jgi:KaiC/GvpD/RAD55 family RecA-like ATPase
MTDATPPADRERLSTGVTGLDGALGGGLPAGDLVALVAPPTSGAERLLYALGSANPTRYLSTLRPPAEVHDAMAAVDLPDDDDDVDLRAVDADALLDTPADHLSGLDAGSVVVVDPATELERAGEDRYRSFLDDLKRHCRTTESVAVCHCPRTTPRTLRRDLTLGRADTTLVLHREVDPDGSRSYLDVGKFRHGRPPTEPVALDLRGRPTVADGSGG